MRQLILDFGQLAQRVADFLEPVIPYLVIRSKKADEEAGRKVGVQNWQIKKELWEKLTSVEDQGLKEAAADVVIAPSDLEVEKALVQKLMNIFKKNPELADEISFYTQADSGTDKEKILEEFSSLFEAFIAKRAGDLNLDQFDFQNKESSPAESFEEFSRLLEAFIAKKTKALNSENTEPSNGENLFSGSSFSGGDNLRVDKPGVNYTHIQLNQGTISEKTPIDIRMAKIAQMNLRGPGEFQKIQNLLFLISEVDGPGTEEVLEKALDFASQIQYANLRAQLLSLLIPYFTGPGQNEFIKKALYSISFIQDETERALVLSALTPHLRGPGKAELITDIFDSAFYFKYGDVKFQILSALLPHLYGSKNEEPLEKALELASVIQSNYQTVQAFALLVPYLKLIEREEILEKALDLAFKLKDKDLRPKALSFIIPYLDEPRKKEILNEAFKLASEIKSEKEKAGAIASLEPFLE